MTIMDGGAPSDTEALLVMVQGYRREAVAEAGRLRDKLAASEALLEGMTTEAKRRAEHAELRTSQLSNVLAREYQVKLALARAHAHHMFGDRPGCDDRMAALGYLRNHGLPEATPADLDAACEGLETPWGSGPGPGPEDTGEFAFLDEDECACYEAPCSCGYAARRAQARVAAAGQDPSGGF